MSRGAGEQGPYLIGLSRMPLGQLGPFLRQVATLAFGVLLQFDVNAVGEIVRDEARVRPAS